MELCVKISSSTCICVVIVLQEAIEPKLTVNFRRCSSPDYQLSCVVTAVIVTVVVYGLNAQAFVDEGQVAY